MLIETHVRNSAKTPSAFSPPIKSAMSEILTLELSARQNLQRKMAMEIPRSLRMMKITRKAMARVKR